MKRIDLTLVSTKTFSFSIANYSSLIRANRVLAYCLRFVNNSKNKSIDKHFGPLSVSEIKAGMQILVKIAQQDSFHSEINLLTNSLENAKGKLAMFAPFIDNEGVLRVGGRLRNSQLQYNAKHPILLDGKHHLSKLILENNHKILCHAGPQLLLATVRQNYWFISGMNAAKKVVRNCLKCYRLKPKSIEPQMANLPQNRVVIATPFNTIGVDYAGPFLIKKQKWSR